MNDTTVLPDGSAFFTASLPLPKGHWLYEPRCEAWDSARDTTADAPHPILTHRQRSAVTNAIRYAIRGATMNGADMDFDPDALVQNAVYALCGPFGKTTACMVERSSIYELNARGTNRWWAHVQAGQDDDGKRISEAECEAIARCLTDCANRAITTPPQAARGGEAAALRDAAKAFYNMTMADPSVAIRAPSSEKRDAIHEAGESLRELLPPEAAQLPPQEPAPAAAETCPDPAGCLREGCNQNGDGSLCHRFRGDEPAAAVAEPVARGAWSSVPGRLKSYDGGLATNYERTDVLNVPLFAPARDVGAVPAQPKLIGWRTSDYLMETSDHGVAKGWSVHFTMLPIFDGDLHTKLAPQAEPNGGVQ